MTSDDLRSLADEATPGPWTVHWYEEDGKITGVQGLDLGSDDFIETDGTSYGPNIPNARLIALAPDLARLCADALDVVAELLWDEWSAERPYTGSFPEIEEMFVRLESLEAR